MDIVVVNALASHVRQLRLVAGDQPAATNVAAAFERRVIAELLGLLEGGRIDDPRMMRRKLEGILGEEVELGDDARERIIRLLGPRA